MIRRPPRSTQSRSSAASDVYKRQENVPLIVGMAEALTRAESLREAYVRHTGDLRNLLWEEIQAIVPDVRLNGPGPGASRLSNNLNVSFRGVQGETALLGLDMQG